MSCSIRYHFHSSFLYIHFDFVHCISMIGQLFVFNSLSSQIFFLSLIFVYKRDVKFICLIYFHFDLESNTNTHSSNIERIKNSFQNRKSTTCEKLYDNYFYLCSIFFALNIRFIIQKNKKFEIFLNFLKINKKSQTGKPTFQVVFRFFLSCLFHSCLKCQKIFDINKIFAKQQKKNVIQTCLNNFN